MQHIIEDTETRNRVVDPMGAYLNARARGRAAQEKYTDFFASEEHLDRLDEVSSIIKSFFGCLPSYSTPRFGYKVPFEAVKVEGAGFKIARASRKDKQEKLYDPLEKLGKVTFKVTNGHFIVRVFPSV